MTPDSKAKTSGPFFIILFMFKNILAWNSRGAASRTFPSRIREIQKGNHIDVLIICETRVSGSKADTIIRKLGFSFLVDLT